MVRQYSFYLILIIFGSLSTPLYAQQLPSCEDQLAETLATLSFVRAARQGTEETAGRVTATLQKRLDTSVKEADTLRHPATPVQELSPSPVREDTPLLVSPQKDHAS